MKTEKAIDVSPIDNIISGMASREIELQRGIREFVKFLSKGDDVPANTTLTTLDAQQARPRRRAAAGGLR